MRIALACAHDMTLDTVVGKLPYGAPGKGET
jgi:hypothetical protein